MSRVGSDQADLAREGGPHLTTRAQNKKPNMVKLEQNPDYLARPPVVIWHFRPDAKSA